MTRGRRKRFARVGEMVPRVLEDLGIGGSARIVQIASGVILAAGGALFRPDTRPTKKQRRQIHRFRQEQDQ